MAVRVVQKIPARLLEDQNMMTRLGVLQDTKAPMSDRLNAVSYLRGACVVVAKTQPEVVNFVVEQVRKLYKERASEALQIEGDRAAGVPVERDSGGGGDSPEEGFGLVVHPGTLHVP